MWRSLILGVLLLFSVSFGQEAKLTPAPKLQGKWEVIEMNLAGDQVDPKAIFGKVTWEVRDDKLTFALGKRDVFHKLKINDKKEPAWIDLYPQDPMYLGKVSLGIFKFEGDVLVIISNARGQGPRPKDFSLPDLESGNSLYRMKRIK